METKRTRNDDARVTEIARSLDCITEAELRALGDLKPGTVEAWRKRGTGPSYILFGNRFYYPRKAVAEFLAGQVRHRKVFPAKAML